MPTEQPWPAGVQQHLSWRCFPVPHNLDSSQGNVLLPVISEAEDVFLQRGIHEVCCFWLQERKVKFEKWQYILLE